jgi:hypothetical protein
LPFNPKAYGADVAELLALDGDGERLMPLVAGSCSLAEATRKLSATSASKLFPHAYSPQGALAGLWLYFSCFEEAHTIAQDLDTVEGSFWHAIVHRQEPDSGNSAYWFGRVGTHPVYSELFTAAEEILVRHPGAGLKLDSKWDPFGFVAFCERARHELDSGVATVALEIQRAEWQLLFDYCARRQ